MSIIKNIIIDKMKEEAWKTALSLLEENKFIVEYTNSDEVRKDAINDSNRIKSEYNQLMKQLDKLKCSDVDAYVERTEKHPRIFSID